MLKLPIYMDYHATTPMDPRVLEAMRPYFVEDFGNAASRNHAFGWKAEAAVDKARKQIAALIGASDKEIVFTSGATESNNLAIKGAAHFYKSKGRHIITMSIEHKAVLDTCRELERQGFEVTYLDPEPNGLLDLATRLFDDGLGLPAPGVAARGRIAEMLAQPGNHRVDDARVNRRGGAVVQIDGEVRCHVSAKDIEMCRRRAVA